MEDQMSRIARLESKVSQLRSLLSEAEEELEEAKLSLEWNSVCKKLEEDPNALAGRILIEDAIEKFKQSFNAPLEYDGEVPYPETDDCGDFSPLEDAIDKALAMVSDEGAPLTLLAVTLALKSLYDWSIASSHPIPEFDDCREELMEQWRQFASARGSRWGRLISKIGPPFEMSL
jgi:hypothetical protein